MHRKIVVATLSEWPSSLFSDIDVGYVVNRTSDRMFIKTARDELDALFSALFDL